MSKWFKEKYKSSRNLQVFVIICGGILFYSLLNHFGAVRSVLGFLIGVIAPLVSAAILAFILHPVVSFIEKKLFGWIKLKNGKYLHGFSVIFIVLVICLIIIILLYFIITQLATSVTHLISNFDNYIQTFVQMLERLFKTQYTELNVLGVNLLDLEGARLQDLGNSIMQWVTQHAEGIIGSAMRVGSNVMNTLITIMLTVYMLLDVNHLKKSFSRVCRSLMPPERYIRFSEVSTRSQKIFIRYFLSNILDSLIIGVACYLFMIILGLPYAVLIAVVVGVSNFIPTFGPIVGAVIGGFLILMIDPLGTLWFIIYTLVSQFIDANVIKPKLFGDTTGLRPMWVLASIIICGGLFGVVGMLLGVPLFAIIAIIANEHIEKRLQRWDYVKEDAEG